MNDLPPFSSEVEQVVAAAKATHPVAEEIADRVEKRVWSTLGLMPAGLPGRIEAPVVSGSAALKVMAIGVVALTSGVVAWNASQPRPAPVPTQPPAAVAVASTPPSPAAETAATEVESPIASRPTPRFAKLHRDGSSGPVEIRSTLAEEEQLIEQARSRLAEHDPESAQMWLQKHARKFPRGQLSEERDALTIRSLLATGNAQSGLAALSAFRKRYPDSVLLPMLEALSTNQRQ